MYFEYGEKEIEYLKSKDKKLGCMIEKIGHIYREVDSDLFSAVVHNIISQQISTKAQLTIWNRMKDNFGDINFENICNSDIQEIQSFGITFKKAEYIKDFALKIKNGELNLKKILKLSDEEAIRELVKLKGIGIWTAEMILLFCMQRPNISSYNDLGIQNGLKIIYHHKEIDKKLFEKYRKRFSPYCSVASLYLWEVAGNKISDNN